MRLYILFSALWLIVMAVLVMFHEILMPFFVAGLLAFVLNPLVNYMKLPRWAGILAVYVALIFGAIVAAVYLLPKLYWELNKAIANLSEFYGHLTALGVDESLARVTRWLNAQKLPIYFQDAQNPASPPSHALMTVDMQTFISQGLQEISSYIQNRSAQIIGQVQSVIGGIFRFIFQFFLVLMLTAFMLLDTKAFSKGFMMLLPKAWHDDAAKFLLKLDTGLSGVVRGQLLICLVNGVLTLIGLLIFQIKFAFLLATIAGVMSLIPIFGSILSTLPIALVALSQSVHLMVISVLWIVGIHLLEANFLNPKIMGNATHIHPVVVIFALVAGEHFYGLTGAFLAMPVASIVLALMQTLLQKAQYNTNP